MLEYLKDLVESTNPKGLIPKVKANAELMQYISGQIPEPVSLKEKIYLVLNNKPVPVCPHNNVPSFNNFEVGYRSYCGAGKHCECRRRDHSKKIKDIWESRSEEEKVRITNNGKHLNTVEAQEKAKKTNLERYGVEKPFQSKEIQQKTNDSYKSKTGYESPFHDPAVQERSQQSSINRYGGLMKHARKALYEKYNGNPFGNQNIQKKIRKTIQDEYGSWPSGISEIRSKISNTNMIRYGVPNPAQKHYSDDLKGILLSDEEIVKQYTENGMSWFIDRGMTAGTVIKKLEELGAKEKRQSRQEMFIQNLLDTHNISYVKNTRTVIAPFEIDFYVPSKKFAIEVNGIYWHSENAGKKHKQYHNKKTEECRKLGIHLLHLWDAEIDCYPDLVSSRLKHILGITSTKIYARKTQIEELTYQQTKEFFNRTHSQRSVPSKICYGLVHQNNVVAAMSFSKSRYNKKYQFELLRYSSLPDTCVVGGASKLLNHFRKAHNNPGIISYSDRRYSCGNLYLQLGFDYSHTSLPNYYYTRNYCDLESRQTYQKHKLKKILPNFDQNKTEWQNMLEHGFDRVWDCGNDVWVLE